MSAPDPSCPMCGGSGTLEEPAELPHPPRFSRCRCVIRGDIQLNVERMMAGLWEAPPIKESPLLGKQEVSLAVTAGEEFAAHLRHLAVRMPTTWVCRVISDAELTTAWLASIALQGKDILDADAYKVSTQHLTIPDLVIPPDLLVIRMGVKVARNSAASECLAEALNLRYHEKLPTWVWDEPTNRLEAGHLFWSDIVGRILRPWEKISGLEKPGAVVPAAKARPGKPSASPSAPAGGRKTLRGGGES